MCDALAASGTISFGYCSVLSGRKVCLQTVPMPLRSPGAVDDAARRPWGSVAGLVRRSRRHLLIAPLRREQRRDQQAEHQDAEHDRGHQEDARVRLNRSGSTTTAPVTSTHTSPNGISTFHPNFISRS